jgi:hypothetical protein
MGESAALRTEGPLVDGLVAMLRRLDGWLKPAVMAWQSVAPEAADDPYRGLYISPADVGQLLARSPGEPTLHRNGLAQPEAGLEAFPFTPRLAWLKATYGLDTFDLDIIVLALAPELDLRYERIYAYLQDDVTRRRPTVDLALNLFCTSPADRLARRVHLGPHAPLIATGLLHLTRDPSQVQPPLLSHYLTLDDRLLRWLLGLEEHLAIAPAPAAAVPMTGGAEERSAGEPPDRGPSPSFTPLAALAHKFVFPYGWDDLVLPPDQYEQLREICTRASHRDLVYNRWGFGRKLAHGRGLHVLFSGPPGTGKTMAAAIIANELDLDLYRIDLAQVVSKYIGETEKNLERVFVAAEHSGAVLFFDEADALFGKRSDVKDAHDRYANIEISYLLQRMEEYDGLAILATNVRQHLDEAFLRRLQVSVEFPFPDEEHRRRIWATLFPAEAPLGPDVDFDLLARELKLAGGNLKNIALAAAFYAAAKGTTINLAHLARAALREHEKLGRSWDEMALRASATTATAALPTLR